MVYASPIELSDLLFTNLSGNNNTSSPVRIFYKNIPLDSIAGPVPVVDLSISYNNTDAGMPLSVTTRVTIIGKIIRSPEAKDPDITIAPGSGIGAVMSGIQQLKQLFSDNNGEFRLDCGDKPVIKSTGPCKVNSFSAKPGSDNMVYSADYVVELEFNEPPTTGANTTYRLVSSAEDSWSMESLENYTYMSTSITPSGKIENHNPNLGTTTDLKLVTLPRFKLSRKVSAVGLPYGSGDATVKIYPAAFYNAKKWVENQLSQAFTAPTGSSGQPTVSNQTITGLSNFTNLFLYNHLRSTNFDYLNASYEVNDTWLAMSTGVPYLEDYTIESSTDDKYIKTVRVKGSIEGLVISNIDNMKGSGLIPNDKSILDFSRSMITGITSNMSVTKLDDLQISRNNKLNSHKYNNAYSGWLYDIKPYLYRRACAAVNSFDRTKEYVPHVYDSQPALNNPVYSKERLLNFIPVSHTESHDPKKGTVSYSYEYSNKLSLFSGVISDSISIDHTGPVDVFNQAFVLGRRLGPAVQSLGSKTSSYKKLTIELSVPVPKNLEACLLSSPSCPIYTGGQLFQKMEELINGVRPFGSRTTEMFGAANPAIQRGSGQSYLKGDSITWNPVLGSFSRSLEWVYQHCNNSLNRPNLSEM